MWLSSFLRLLPLYLVWGSIVFFRILFAQQTPNNVLNSGIDTFIDQILSDWNSPGGVGIAVVQRDSQSGTWNVETKGYGIANLNGSNVTENTLFPIGSNSKLFTVLATGMLIDNQTLSPGFTWTSKIRSIIPTWGLQDYIAVQHASIIDLMSHRTGLPRHDFAYKSSDDVPTMINKAHFLRPSAEFRDVWQYTNIFYIVLSYLPELLPSKLPIARYVKQFIFDPLGMTATTYSFDKANSTGQLSDGLMRELDVNYPSGNGPVRALPFWLTKGGEDGNALSGAGGVITTAVDTATFLQTLLLNGGKPGTNQSVIPADAIQMAATGFGIEYPVALYPELSPTVYGGGQERSSYRGHEIIEHTGSVPGFVSVISRIPYDNIGVAVHTNDQINGANIMEIIKFRLIDEALGLTPIDWNSRLQAASIGSQTLPPIPRAANASPPAIYFSSLAGKYTNPGYGVFELCFVSSNSTAASPSCKELAANVPTILPGVVNASVPTYLAAWDSPLASHISLTHYDGNVFNLSTLSSYPTGDPSKPFWVGVNLYSGSTGVAEVAVQGSHIGFGFTDFWGAGTGVPSPQGATVRERAEVWFDKV